jgi:DNA-binding Xre family transcriptional regulator
MKRLEPFRTVKPLFKLMIDREIKWRDINKNITIQPDQLYKLKRGRVPPQYLIDRLCAYLQCTEEDIIGWEV